MKYKCCLCDKKFNAVEAVDGFDQGYKVGFLCPKCGGNIQDKILSSKVIYSNKKSSRFFNTLAAIAIGSLVLGQIYAASSSFRVVSFGLLVLALIYAHFKFPHDLYNKVLSTQAGPGKYG